MRLKQTLIVLSHILQEDQCSEVGFPRPNSLDKQWCGLQTSLKLWDHGKVTTHLFIACSFVLKTPCISPGPSDFQEPLIIVLIEISAILPSLNRAVYLVLDHKQSFILPFFFQSLINITTQTALLLQVSPFSNPEEWALKFHYSFSLFPCKCKGVRDFTFPPEYKLVHHPFPYPPLVPQDRCCFSLSGF